MNGYNPSVPDKASEYLAGGIQQLGNGLMQGLEKRDLNLREIGWLTSQANAAAQTGQLTADDLHQFMAGNLNKKREIISQNAAVLDFHRQQQQLEMQQQAQNRMAQGQDMQLGELAGRIMGAQRSGAITAEDANQYLGGNPRALAQGAGLADFAQKLLNQKQEQQNFTPPQATVQALNGMGYEFAPQSKHGGTWFKKPNPNGIEQPTVFDLPGVGAVVDLGNGKRQLAKAPADKPLTTADANMVGLWEHQLTQATQALNTHTTALGNGDDRYFTGDPAEKGGHYPFGKKRQERIDELLPKISGLQTQINSVTQGRQSAVPPNPSPLSASPQIVTVTSKEQRDALPAGAFYKGPDGVTRQKKQ